MIFLLIILLLLQLLTYLIIRGGTMNKSPEEIEYELDAESKWLKEQTQKDESSPSQSKASSSVMAELETFNPKRDDRVDQDLKTKEKKKSSPKSKITNFPLIQKEVRHPMPIQQAYPLYFFNV